MNITTLIEDRMGSNKELHIEHGLSIYFEIDNKKVLFDTGSSRKFIDNAEDLNIDLEDLDYVFISHNHYDHSGGLKALIDEINPDFELYIGNSFFNKKYILEENEDYRCMMNEFDKDFLKSKDISTNYVKGRMLNITENLLVFSNFNRNTEFENTNTSMYIKEDEIYKKDLFLDEITLGIKTDKGLIVLVGCSHPGIVNILDTLIQGAGMNIYALIGGTHLLNEDEQKINRIIEYIKDKDIKVVSACHCTGEKALKMMKEQLPGRFQENKTGNTLEI